ncbi:hypothetical protein P3T37_006150 [Kitasatospora sp. MAA4]|uniref:hypothetical protein n=1 Tax=Kitasatospora sp. MAA4 TaxID=3035093 RepID=UPI0024759567|nr:hypothetical protein [Kitasatospora sp. MAA4]MDH6136719.1 hypothetical protein [Kitasatospora sp. MAA4]
MSGPEDAMSGPDVPNAVPNAVPNPVPNPPVGGRRAVPARCLGLALAVSACPSWTHGIRSGADLALLLIAALFGWWAGPPVTGRPVRGSSRWTAQLARHRNTALAVATVILAAISGPPGWSAAALTVLLLGYLLFVDAASYGRRPTGPLPAVAAYAAAALVLLAAFVPSAASSWARLPAALGVAVAALAVASAFWFTTPDRKS